jgi:hypothetical protein
VVHMSEVSDVEVTEVTDVRDVLWPPLLYFETDRP